MKISIILPAVLVFVGCASEPVVQRAETLPSAVTRIEDSWVQLFDGPNFTGRSLTVKYPMDILTLREVATDDGTKGFDDKASSVKWCLPQGHSFVIYQDLNFGGKQLELKGNGAIQQINDLDRQGQIGNQASSARWLRNTDERILLPTGR